jgi:hypothetical protein
MYARLASEAVAAHETHDAEGDTGNQVDGEIRNDDLPVLI